MDIKFVGKYKSITNFEWFDIPEFVVITGQNGTGKSQLLELIHATITKNPRIPERLAISGKQFRKGEVTFLKGEWQLQDSDSTSFSSIQHEDNDYYSKFRGSRGDSVKEQFRLLDAFDDVLTISGKTNPKDVPRDEFITLFNALYREENSMMSKAISRLFYDYRLSEIELRDKRLSDDQIVVKLGERPWIVLREILNESRLPFEVNDPSEIGVRDTFDLQLTHSVLGEEIKFRDLSSGEKVLISLVFHLYNSQEKGIFPKLLLLDEPDAHLHPSMSKQFLDVVKNVFVKKYGIQVLMTTHSPSTVILAPDESIYEMSIEEPRIRKGSSKNHCVSLLTGGLVFVGKGTKFVLVEDNDDVDFYSHVYNHSATEGLVDSDIPIVFIPASTKDSSGGKSVVQNWVNKLKDSGLVGVLQGLIDADNGNDVDDGIHKIDRYSIENYLADPILVYAILIDNEKAPPISGIEIPLGKEHSLKSLDSNDLQKIADKIFELIYPGLKSVFTDFNEADETQMIEVEFADGQKLNYPRWLLNRRGKDIINKLYINVFGGSVLNQTILFKTFRKLNMIPKELISKLTEMKNG